MAKFNEDLSNELFEITVHINSINGNIARTHIFHKVSDLEIASSSDAKNPLMDIYNTPDHHSFDTRYDMRFLSRLAGGVNGQDRSVTVIDWDVADIQQLIDSGTTSLKALVPVLPLKKLYLLSQTNVAEWEKSREDALERFGLEGLADILREQGYYVTPQEEDEAPRDGDTEEDHN